MFDLNLVVFWLAPLMLVSTTIGPWHLHQVRPRLASKALTSRKHGCSWISFEVWENMGKILLLLECKKNWLQVMSTIGLLVEA